MTDYVCCKSGNKVTPVIGKNCPAPAKKRLQAVVSTKPSHCPFYVASSKRRLQTPVPTDPDCAAHKSGRRLQAVVKDKCPIVSNVQCFTNAAAKCAQVPIPSTGTITHDSWTDWKSSKNVDPSSVKIAASQKCLDNASFKQFTNNFVVGNSVA